MSGKIIILAAGKGTRMRPITEEVPKALIEVAGKPFLHWLLKTVQKAGYTDIGIIVGYKKEMIEEFLKQVHFPVSPEHVFLMPEGRDLPTVAKRSELIVSHCLTSGFRYGRRIQLDLFGDKRGS